MKITKYNHSCLVIEENKKVFLIDPGEYSVNLLMHANFSQLDYLLITHEHFDHFFLPFIQDIVKKFPNIKIITTRSVVSLLNREGIQAVSEGDENVSITPTVHEKIWMGNRVENFMFTLFDKFSHPGDSLSFETTAGILCLPISGPWCNTTQAVELGERLRPKTIIPIHDWHWKDEVRIGMHNRLRDYFKEKDIVFIPIESTKIVEL